MASEAARRGGGGGPMPLSVPRVLGLIVLLAVWAGIAATGAIPQQYLPSPSAVWQAFLDANRCVPLEGNPDRIVCGAQNYYLWEHLLASLQRIAVGVGAALAVGLAVGFLMALFRPVGALLSPYLNFIRALPPLGYIGLIIIWVGIGEPAKYWLLFLAAFPPIVIATISGVKSTSLDRIHAVQSMGANRWQVLRYVTLPGALVSIVGGVRLAAGFAWTTVVAAELNNGIPGIGGLAYVSGTQLNTPLTLASVIVIGLTALALDGILQLVGNRLVPWQGKA